MLALGVRSGRSSSKNQRSFTTKGILARSPSATVSGMVNRSVMSLPGVVTRSPLKELTTAWGSGMPVSSVWMVTSISVSERLKVKLPSTPVLSSPPMTTFSTPTRASWRSRRR